MKSTSMLLTALVALAAFGTAVGLLGGREKNTADEAVLIDNSFSQPLQCEFLPAMVLSEKRDMVLGKQSELFISHLGSNKTAYEPELDLRTALPRKGGSLFNGGGDSKLVKDIRDACEKIKPVGGSSIFRAVQVNLQQLQSKGPLNPATPSKLIVITDLEDNVSRAQFEGPPGSVPPSLPNNRISVIICGYAVTEGGGPRGEHTEQLIAKWKAHFSDPSSVRFKAYCDGWTKTVSSSQ